MNSSESFWMRWQAQRDTAFRTRPHAKPRNHALDDNIALTSAPPLRFESAVAAPLCRRSPKLLTFAHSYLSGIHTLMSDFPRLAQAKYGMNCNFTAFGGADDSVR